MGVSLKTLREKAEAIQLAGVTTREKLNEALPALIQLQAACETNARIVVECRKTIKALNDACSEYALNHPTCFTNGLLAMRDGTQSGDVVVDNTTYHFVTSIMTDCERDNGENFTGAFLKSLPKELTKTKLELNKDAEDAELAQHGIVRKTKNTWSEVQEAV